MKTALMMFVCTMPLFAGQGVDVEVKAPELHGIASAGFHLTKDSDVTLRWSGIVYSGRARGGEGIHYYYGWILNSQTRKPVWHVRHDQGMQPQDGLMRAEKTLTLPAGDYEMYYVAVEDTTLIRRRKKLMDHKFIANFEAIHKKLGMKVTGPANQMKPVDAEQLRRTFRRGAAVSISQMGRNQVGEVFFRLKKPTRFQVYAIGEGRRRDGSIYDYPWIANAETEQRLWSMRARAGEYAGGHGKNLAQRDVISFPAGTYRLRYMSDESHAFGSWNAGPPYDPYHWGVTLWPIQPGVAANVEVLTTVSPAKPILELAPMKNAQHLYKGFEVKQDINLRVLCLGEGTDVDDMGDHGWIVNKDTGGIHWAMQGRRTYHAGGAVKNRMVEERIHFPKGRYMVYYHTDDTHAADLWNAGAPHDPRHYGISLWLTDQSNAKMVGVWSPDKKDDSATKLVSLVQAGNHAYEEAFFELHDDTQVRILVLGEGTQVSGMIDFGWIENDDTGRVVWEMQYPQTTHAGGANKNRKLETTLNMKRGRYKVIYETDGSHAFQSWNADAPRSPELYGITIYLTQ